MRISEDMKMTNILSDLTRTMTRMLKTQTDISTTKRIHQPSDDPSGTAQLMRLKNTDHRYEQYQKSVEDATYWVTATESTLNQGIDVITDANNILLQAGNDTLGPSERSTLSGQMQALWEKTAQLANQKFENKYLMGGTNYLTPPYELTDEITGESYTAAFDSVYLDNVRLESGTLEVEEQYAEGADFSIDYLTGEIQTLGAGSMTDGATYLISYETPSGTVEDEAFVADMANPVSLSQSPVNAGSVTVRRVFEEGVDYTVDYAKGAITALDTGSLADGGSYLVNYQTEFPSVATLNPDGVNGAINRKIDEGTSMQINFSATDFIGSSDDLLNRLKEATIALERNDTSQFTELRSGLDDDLNRITRLLGEVGVKADRLDFTGQKLDTDSVNLRKLISSIEDTDVAAAILQLDQDEAIYNAALKTGAQLIKTTLLDYI